MKQPITTFCALIAAVIVGGIFAPQSNGQQPAQPTHEAIEIARIIGEIEQQQAQFTANQEAMEKRLTTITEELRLARIYATRAGGNKK